MASLVGGILIGLASVWLLAASGRIAGISGILHGLFGAMSASPPGDRLWRILFVLGLVAAGFAWHAFVAPAPAATADGPAWPFSTSESWLFTRLGVGPETTRLVALALIATTIGGSRSRR